MTRERLHRPRDLRLAVALLLAVSLMLQELTAGLLARGIAPMLCTGLAVMAGLRALVLTVEHGDRRRALALLPVRG